MVISRGGYADYAKVDALNKAETAKHLARVITHPYVDISFKPLPQLMSLAKKLPTDMGELITLQMNVPQWEDWFADEAKLLFGELGDAIAAIHHVGSTAVPDLLAKPIVDIAVEANVFPPSSAICRTLESLGYRGKGEAGVPGRYWFIKGQPRKFNLHYCVRGSGIVSKQVLFRDRLIENGRWRRGYEAIKLQNYRGRDVDSTEYADSKSAFIDKVIGLER